MILKYINSFGEEVDFRKYETQIYQGQFHSSNWQVESISQIYGTSISAFKKDALTLEFVVAVRGDNKEDNLNDMFNIFEKDIVNNKLGKLYWGDYYINCVILNNTTIPSDTFFGAENTLEIYAPYPFWIKEVEKTFYKGDVLSNEKGLDYNYNYTYDYTPNKKGIANWYIDHFTSSNFKMTIYGPCVDPLVNINGHSYQVYVTLAEYEYLVIDTTNNNNTITQYRKNGTTVNLFDLRGGKNTNQSVFTPIPSGNLLINWNGNFNFSLKLYLERGVPKW